MVLLKNPTENLPVAVENANVMPQVFFILSSLLLLLQPGMAQMTLNPDFDQKIKESIDQSIPVMSCKELQTQLNSSPNIFILDAREWKEYSVSHLPSARYIGYDSFNAAALKGISKSSPILIYCSIGYRSEKTGEKLRAMGYKKVYNLYGGIFEWSNQGYLLKDKHHQNTRNVHVYSKEWGQWLERGKKIY